MHSTTVLLAVAAIAGTAIAQTTAAPAGEPTWTFAFSAFTYHVDADHSYVQPTVFADRGELHLEARWNYEALDTGSVWAGWNFATGEALHLEITPMLGAAFGQTNGVAPGYRGTLGWGAFELASEGEYLIDTDDADDSFFYTWSELAWSPTEWLRLGAVAQRTRVYDTDLDTQRGFLIGLSFERVAVTAYWFNPDESELTAVLGVDFTF